MEQAVLDSALVGVGWGEQWRVDWRAAGSCMWSATT